MASARARPELVRRRPRALNMQLRGLASSETTHARPLLGCQNNYAHYNSREPRDECPRPASPSFAAQAGQRKWPQSRRNHWAARGKAAHSFVVFTLLNSLLLAFARVEAASNSPAQAAAVENRGEGDVSIELVRFQVPPKVRVGEKRRLYFPFKLNGASLHAVKLFKDDQEFYRFTPSDQKMAFQVPGVQVDLGRSGEHDVWLTINKLSSGQYKCQVLIEGTFKSISSAKRMEVITGPGSEAAGGWQRHSAAAAGQQPQLDSSARSHLTRQQAAVQQHQSQMYGVGGGLGGSLASGAADNSGAAQLPTMRTALAASALALAVSIALTLNKSTI